MMAEKAVERHITPRLAPLLTEAELLSMHLSAIELLQEVGIGLSNAHLRKLLAGQEGLSLRDDRLYIAGGLVETTISLYRADQRAAARSKGAGEEGHILLETGAVGRYVVDLETDAVRPAAWEDAVLAVQLAEALRPEGVQPSVPCIPQEVPPAMQAVAEFLIGSRYSRGGGTFVSSSFVPALEYVFRMHGVLGQAFSLPLYMKSPLQIDGDSLDAVLSFLGRAQSYRVSSMPMRGVSAPIHLIGGFVQSIAESLAGLVILKAIAGDVPVTFSLHSFPFDMRTATMSYGSPELNLAEMIKRELSAYYGMEDVSTLSIRSMAKRPGAQASAEKAASAMAGALSGSRHFYGAGQLALDEVFSAEQLVIDREIADYVEQLVRGFDIGVDPLSVEIIRESIAEGGSFLDRRSTAAEHRRAFWMPPLLDRTMVVTWQELGEPAVRERARARVRQKLAAPYGSGPIENGFQLPADTDRELTALYERAWRELA